MPWSEASAPSIAPAGTGLPGYFRWVDALRGAAALAVVVYHYHHFYLRDHASRAEIPDLATFPYAVVLDLAYRHGYLAVQLFWVISGFVFAHVYLTRPATFRGFWVARFARLYPLHFVTLLAVAAMQAFNWHYFGTWQIFGSNDLRHFVLHLLLASNWTTLSRAFVSFNGPIWSVSLELVAYGVFFLSLPLLRLGGLAVAAGLCALAAVLAHASWFDPPLLRPWTLVCVSYFFFGTCTYIVLGRLRRHGVTLGIALALAGCALALDLHAPAIASISAALIVAAAALDARGIGRGAGVLSRLGDMSYSLYLVHVPLQIAFLTAVDLVSPGARGFADAWWLLPAYLAVTCLVAAQVYRRFEVPAGRALRRLGEPRSRPASAPG